MSQDRREASVVPKQSILPALSMASWGRLGVAGLGVLSLPLAILFFDGLASLPRFVALFLVAFAFYLAGCGLVLRCPQAGGRPLVVFILTLALVARLAMLFTSPGLSDDLYRYVWDGKVSTQGINPYRHAPDDPALAPLRDNLWPGINHRQMVTPYPPLAQAQFALAYRAWPDSLKPMQVAAAVADVLVMVVLLALLRAGGQPATRVVIYAWNPLPLAQFAHSAHNDALMLGLLLLALWAADARRPYLGAAALAGAVLAKFVPILAAPTLARRWGWRPTVLFVLLIPVGYLPFLGDGEAVLRGIFYEAGDARFNDSLYLLLSRGLGLIATTPEAVARPAVALLFAVWMAYLLVRPPIDQTGTTLRVTYLALGGYILLSPSVEPWYLTWMLPFLCFYLQPGRGRWPFAFTPALGWLLLSGLVELTELTYGSPQSRLWVVVRTIEYAPLFLLLGAEMLKAGVRLVYNRV